MSEIKIVYILDLAIPEPIRSAAEENAQEFTLTLNHEFNNVNNWLTSSRICINADKTKYMIFPCMHETITFN